MSLSMTQIFSFIRNSKKCPISFFFIKIYYQIILRFSHSLQLRLCTIMLLTSTLFVFLLIML